MVNHIRISISRFFARSLVLSIVRRISEVSLASSLFRVSSFPRGASFSLVVYAYASADTFRERSCRTVYGSTAPLTLLPTNPAVRLFIVNKDRLAPTLVTSYLSERIGRKRANRDESEEKVEYNARLSRAVLAARATYVRAVTFRPLSFARSDISERWKERRTRRDVFVFCIRPFARQEIRVSEEERVSR